MEKIKKVINVITLGCSKNLVDSEHLMAQLERLGWKIVFDSNCTDAKVVIINTCGFIGDAKEESVNTILNFVRAKERGVIEKLYVMGCLSERYKTDLEQEIPEVDRFFGASDLRQIVTELKGEYAEELRTKRHLTTPKHYAYLKIAEGCNWHCGYCAIPLIRGAYRSVPMNELIDEAQRLVADGVKELIVIAQDTTYYGLDLYGKRCLADLLRSLCRIEGVEWVRLHYAYPTHFPMDVLDVMREEPKMCRYLDIPLQHVSDAQLAAMHRGLNHQQTVELVAKIREQVPEITLRTTLISGYPGESEQDFKELLQFVEQTRFERLGVFPYCEEEGTFSAEKLSDDVPQAVKEARADQIMALQNKISAEKNREKTGKVLRVLIDRNEGEFWVGRTEADSPEVDNEVLIPMSEPLSIGRFYSVEITSADDYDLYGNVKISD